MRRSLFSLRPARAKQAEEENFSGNDNTAPQVDRFKVTTGARAPNVADLAFAAADCVRSVATSGVAHKDGGAFAPGGAGGAGAVESTVTDIGAAGTAVPVFRMYRAFTSPT
jgi:hypothetical protein